ncbi:MAG: sugar phosphate isomerase/epimerase [Dorea sp.]|nr:sugar phosphate isomerase/epimerase [Dorea sp.]
MKLSISNIGWGSQQDKAVYQLMKKYGYSGLEIAPTRIFPELPYTKLTEAESWKKGLKSEYGFSVSSMQSIWFGRQEKLFSTENERKILIEYTKQAIDFAAVIGCENLVFGCPRNRFLFENADKSIAISFFRELGDYAEKKGTAIGMEANPVIYNTNYINHTRDALELIKEVDSKGFLLNLDIGTMIQNEEMCSVLDGSVHLINHVHISEPGLKPIKRRDIHIELKKMLLDQGYTKYISIEMGKIEDLSIIDEKMQYVKGVFE